MAQPRSKTDQHGAQAAEMETRDRSNAGFVEGLNNKVRVIQRRAYGLRDQEYLRLKILTCMPRFSPKPAEPRADRFRAATRFSDLRALLRKRRTRPRRAPPASRSWRCADRP